MQTKIRRRRMRRLIRISTVWKKFSCFSLGIPKSHSRMYLKLKLDSSDTQCGRIYSVYIGLSMVRSIEIWIFSAYDAHQGKRSLCYMRTAKVQMSLRLIVLRFNYMSALVGHYVSPPREREKEIEGIVEEMKERTWKKEEQDLKWRKRRNNIFRPLPLPATRIAGLAHF